MAFESKVDIKRLINFEKIEDLLQSLLTKVEAQQKAITSLQQLCLSFLPNNKANDTFSDIFASIERLSNRIDVVQEAATAHIGTEKSITAGELSYINSLHIQQISKTLLEKANEKDVKECIAALAVKTESDIKTLREWSASDDQLGKLHEGHKALTSRLNGVENLMTCKLDRSELGRMESLATDLEKYAKFKSEVNEFQSRVAGNVDAHEEEIRRSRGIISDLTRSLESTQAGVKKLAPKSETRALAQLLGVQTEDLKEFKVSTASSYGSIKREIMLNTANITDLTQTVLPSLRGDIAVIETELEKKALKTDLRPFVLRAHFDQVVSVMGETLDTKATNAGLQNLDAFAKSLNTRVDKESTRIDVAVKFVDWFSRRGEQYEHNMRIIDKHLGNLTKASHPANRSPFMNQIKYTLITPNIAAAAHVEDEGSSADLEVETRRDSGKDPTTNSSRGVDRTIDINFEAAQSVNLDRIPQTT